MSLELGGTSPVIAFDAAAPFGGYKKPGYGREMGTDAVEMYTQVKNVIVNLS